MPQVPYNPVPTETPVNQGARNVSVATPGAAFGSTVADAISGLGKVVEGAGSELFARGLALQQLNNETEAREADTKYMIAAGELHANFNSLQGKAAFDAYPGYVKDLEATRVKLRNDMSNPMSQKLFDAQSQSTMGRTIFNGAGHAASQNKQWAIGTAKARIEVNAKTVEDNPNDERLFVDKLAQVRLDVNDLVQLQGMGEGSPQEQQLALTATSKLWMQRLIGMARVDPFGASKVLDKNKTQLTQEDYLRVDNIVRAQGRAVGSVNIANQIYNTGVEGPDQPGKTLASMEEEARRKAKEFNPDDPLLPQHTVAALQAIYTKDKYAKRQEEIANVQAVNGAILSGVRDEQQLRAMPGIADAIDALPKDKRLAIPGMINRYNVAANKVTNDDAYARLTGLSNNDVETFLNTDLTKEPLSQADMRKLTAEQQKIKDNQNSDPRVGSALRVIRGSMAAELQALGIFTRTESNKDAYDKFTGGLSQALDVWRDTHGKPATAKDILETIAPQLIRQETKPWSMNTPFGKLTSEIFKSNEPFYAQEVPPEWADKLTAEVVAKGGLAPTPEQINKAYLRSQFIKLYGKPAAKSQDRAPSRAPATEVRPPISE